LLLEGHAVSVFDNTTAGPALAAQTPLLLTYRDTYTYIPGTIRDPQSLTAAFLRCKPEVAIHLAARAGVRASVTDPLGTIEVNLGGSTNVMEACKAHGVSRILFASSSSVYGPPERCDAPSCESDPCRPLSPYAISKLAMEQMAALYARLYGMRVLCLRLFSVYGPRQRPDLVLPIFARQMLEGEPLQVYGDGTSQRDYTYVDDVVEGFVAGLRWVAGASVTGAYDILNLGSGRPVVLNDVVIQLQRALGCGAVPCAYGPALAVDPESTWADLRKTKRILQWRSSVHFAEGVQRFADWFLAQR
jgi:UDP-glucuronate 4-epimerase